MSGRGVRAAVSAEALADELKAVRRGRGLYSAGIGARIGPVMRSVFGVQDADAASVARTKAIRRIQDGCRRLPEELRLAVLSALGIHDEVRDLMLLQDRVEWLATRLRRDTRTARRRVDEGCERLAEILVSGADGRRPGALASEGWYVESFSAVFLLDAGPPTTLERRVVVAERDGLDRIVLAWTLPRPVTDRRGLEIQVLYGGVLEDGTWTSGSRFRTTLALPRALRAGDTHEYSVLLRVAPYQPIRTHWVYVPSTRCDAFDLRVRFGPAEPPERVWRVADAFHRDLDDGRLDEDLLPVDRSGEVHVHFTEMAVGHGYGVQWGPSADA